MGLVLYAAIALAALRSGSSDAFKSIYTLTAVILFYAAIAARYRGAFWYGFAVVGWAYFLLGFGPWIGLAPGSGGNPRLTLNHNLVPTTLIEVVTGRMAGGEAPSAPADFLAAYPQAAIRAENRGGVCHSALTVAFASLGGLTACGVSGRARGSEVANEDLLTSSATRQD